MKVSTLMFINGLSKKNDGKIKGLKAKFLKSSSSPVKDMESLFDEASQVYTDNDA